MANATAFDMPETISGESPATVPFVKPDDKATNSESDNKSSDVLAITSEIFNSLEDARDAYGEFIESCNWKKNPTFAFFVWASEHNWVEDDETGNAIRLAEKDSEYYGFEDWSEDMRSLTDDRWKMDDTGDLVEMSDLVETAATTEPEPDNHDEKFWREMEILTELRAAEIKRQEAATAFDIATEERKEAKEHLATCTAAVTRATAKLLTLNTIPAKPIPAKPVGQGGHVDTSQSQPQATSGESVESTQLAPEPTATTAIAQAAQPEDTSWRNKPTAEIIQGLPGLGKKKFEAIVELCPTVGDMEDKRAEAAKDFVQFKDALPKGCGEAIANAIENALLEYIAEFGQQVKKAKPAEAIDKPAEPEKPNIDDDLADL